MQNCRPAPGAVLEVEAVGYFYHFASMPVVEHNGDKTPHTPRHGQSMVASVQVTSLPQPVLVLFEQVAGFRQHESLASSASP